MDLIKWNKIYQTNIELDGIFYKKYGNDKDIYKKNCLEILVELGEFINETKVFKYWSCKKPYKDKMLDEYADVITMCLYFYREFGLEIDNRYLHLETKSIIELMNYLYHQMSLLMENNNSELIQDIFYNVLYMGELLNISEEEIIDAINKKHQIIKERLESDY